MKVLRLIGIIIILALVVGCGTAPAQQPTTTPTQLPEPSQELLDLIPFAAPKDGPNEDWKEARRAFYVAYNLLKDGNTDEAIQMYQLSINSYPTAEARADLGWAYSTLGLYDQAIQEAQKAIALDPDYGNPYNDIGLYLLQQGYTNEAIPWFEKATQAKRYTDPQVPWLNIGYIWVLNGEWVKAVSAYLQIWVVKPDYPAVPPPALDASTYLPPEPSRNPGSQADQVALKDVMTKYFRAWNSYDPNVVMNYSEPSSSDASAALLLSLASAKHSNTTISVQDVQVLHVQSDLAVTATAVDGNSSALLYLLHKTNGTWRVVAQLILSSS